MEYCLSKTLHIGYWILNLFALLCILNIITSQPCEPNNGPSRLIVQDWPCHWNNGTIPYVFNFYSLTGVRRLIRLVKKGHQYLQKRSCLVFKEYDPVQLASIKNFTYLYYSYSGVLESCCLPFFSKPVGKRLILISPMCTLPAEAAHATLHALGLTHSKHEPFSNHQTRELLFSFKECPNRVQKLATFNSRI